MEDKEKVYTYVGIYGVYITDLKGNVIGLCDGNDNGDDLIEDLQGDARYTYDVIKEFENEDELREYLKLVTGE